MSEIDEHPPVALVRFPPAATHPIIVRFEGVEIEAAICARQTYGAKRDLPPSRWSVLGVYVLSGLVGDGSREVSARPGTVQTRPLLERVDEHFRDAEWWDQVILIRRVTRAFDNAETGYLERLIHDVVDQSAYLRRRAGDNTSNYGGPSSSDAKADLENRILPAIKIALRLGGLKIETAAEMTALNDLPTVRRAVGGDL
ncbi:hypothetical protein NBH00_21550 [Paraconexibacter antarcticus]|uniref:Uncharacterized protein n=1 Tax=Paraconexibacter antarcticus TaxID=2949664 RepID=A0ABY5DTA4_9ACTN|nr:hypothetical protein [Paraconexibacter antarcticus]UTI63915.1 hypothetical protein NBH00_21550 [Paraconexibacter antarcticus]